MNKELKEIKSLKKKQKTSSYHLRMKKKYLET